MRPLLLISLCLLSGCAPLKQKQGAFTGGQGYDHFGFYEDYGLLQIGPSNRKKTIVLLPDKSFAISPRGEKLRIESEPHPYDLTTDHPYDRDRVYVVGRDGKRLRGLTNGKWIFSFALDSPDGSINRTFESHLSNFYYNPVIHGPPN